MNIKYKTPKYLIVFIISSVILLFGILTKDIQSIKNTIRNICITIGSFGIFISLLQLIFALTIYYEAEFLKDKMILTKKNKEVVIMYSNILGIDYTKPTLVNYMFSSTHGEAFPGRLEIALKERVYKLDKYFIKIKHQDVLALPSKYKYFIKNLKDS